MSDDTGEALLKVAREILAKRGYVGLTMKTAAAAAGVTPDVARRYYRNRDALLVAALKLPSDPIAAIPTLVAPGVEGMGERLVRYMLDVLRDPQTRDELVSLARTGANAGHAMLGLQDFLERAVVDRMTAMLGVPDARMRSALITSYLLGVAMARYGVRLEPLASASEEEVVRLVAPVIQDLLDPRKPLPGSSRAPRSAATPAGAPGQGPQGRPARAFDPDPRATAERAAREALRRPTTAAPPPPPPSRTAARPAAAPGPAPAASTPIRPEPAPHAAHAKPEAARPDPGPGDAGTTGPTDGDPAPADGPVDPEGPIPAPRPKRTDRAGADS